MNFKRLLVGLAGVALVALSGCAVNRATASVDPSAHLAAIKSAEVVHVAEDDRRIDKLIAERLNRMGIAATTVDQATRHADATVTYIDRWMWDITMYMIDLTVVVRDPKTDFPMATGNSHHTSLTRKSPPEMVDEVIGNIFKDARK